MKNIKNNLRITCLTALSSMIFLSACNKELESFAPIPVPTYPVGNVPGSLSIGRTLAINKTDTMFYIMLVRSGLLDQYNDSTKKLTLFAVDTTGMKIFVNAATGGFISLTAPTSDFYKFLSGTYPVAPVNLSQATAAGIIQYNTIGQKYPFASFGNGFPNYPLPSLIQLDPLNTPFLRMTICPTNGPTYKYVNNIPATGQPDQIAANGTIHHTDFLVTPPTKVLRDLISAEPTLSYFRAAVLRGDSAADVITPTKPTIDSTKFLNYLLGFGPLNMTVLPPNDAAMQPVLFGILYQGLLAQGNSPAIAFTQATSLSSTPAGFNALPVASVRGIVAYHILASNSTGSFAPNIRVFNANVPTTNSFIKTLVNGSVASHPGVSAIATFTGSLASGLTFSGAGTFPPGGTAFSQPAIAVKRDQNAVNGVYHIIDRVMLPQ
jgi:hypothetical protein